MPINQAMYTGITGLAANGDNMSIIANNIANANNRSFKTDRGEFEDMLTTSLGNNSALGRGTRLRAITTDFSQGALTSTGGITDLGIQGDGFFVVKNPNTEIQESGGMFYTRQGSFRFDKDGYLTDLDGGKLQGYPVERDKPSSRLQDVQIVSNNVPPQATTQASINVNLDARERPPVDDFDIKRPQQTSNYSTSITIFDSMGRSHLSTVYFSRTREGDKNSWNWHATVDGKELNDGADAEVDQEGNPLPAVIGKGVIEFDPEGNPIMNFQNKSGKPTYIDMLEKSDAFEVNFGNGARPQNIQFNFGPMEDENGSLSNQSSQSIAAKSGTLFHSQDGYEAGSLKSLKIDLDGSVRGVFTNGLERRLAVLALATFSNNGGLTKSGHNSYTATPKSGAPRIGAPQSGTRGSVYSASLEESNVDLAQQFVDMITTQRGFQANSKSITTTDSMIEEIINLKR